MSNLMTNATTIRKSKRARKPLKYRGFETSKTISADLIENDSSYRQRMNTQLVKDAPSPPPLKLVIQTSKIVAPLKLVTNALQECDHENKPKIKKLIILKNDAPAKSVNSDPEPETPPVDKHIYKCFTEGDQPDVERSKNGSYQVVDHHYTSESVGELNEINASKTASSPVDKPVIKNDERVDIAASEEDANPDTSNASVSNTGESGEMNSSPKIDIKPTPNVVQSQKITITTSHVRKKNPRKKRKLPSNSEDINSKLICNKMDRNSARSRQMRINNECKRLQSTPEYCDNTRCDRVGNPVIIGVSGQMARASKRRRSDRKTTVASTTSRSGQANSTYYMEIAVRKQLLDGVAGSEGIDSTTESSKSPSIAYTQIMLTTRSKETPNGLNPKAIYEIIDALKKGENDSSRILVLTAVTSYNQIWCGGFDTDYFITNVGGNKGEINLIVELNKAMKSLAQTILGLTKPLIAVVNGECKGIGFAIALLADIIFASDKSSFSTRTGLYFDGKGNIPECNMGMSKTLSDAIGSRLANDMLLTGRNLSAKQAVEFGLISRTLWHTANVMQNISFYIQRMAKNRNDAIQNLKQIMISPVKKDEILKAVNMECEMTTKYLNNDWFKAFKKHIKDQKPKFSFLSH